MRALHYVQILHTFKIENLYEGEVEGLWFLPVRCLLSAGTAMGIPSVRLSVCPSVYHRRDLWRNG